MWLLDLFGSGSGNLKTQNLKSVLPCACFHGVFSWVLGFPVTMLHTLAGCVNDIISTESPNGVCVCESETLQIFSQPFETLQIFSQLFCILLIFLDVLTKGFNSFVIIKIAYVQLLYSRSYNIGDATYYQQNQY